VGGYDRLAEKGVMAVSELGKLWVKIHNIHSRGQRLELGFGNHPFSSQPLFFFSQGDQ
jgi:hypothetical protein